jgi:hypothetical protein
MEIILLISDQILKIKKTIIEIIATIDYTLVHFESVFSDRHENQNNISSF